VSGAFKRERVLVSLAAPSVTQGSSCRAAGSPRNWSADRYASRNSSPITRLAVSGSGLSSRSPA